MAFTDIDAAILVGSMPRREGMERKDLLQANAKIFEVQGKALDQHAKKTVKVSLTSCDLLMYCDNCTHDVLYCNTNMSKMTFSCVILLTHIV